MTDLLTTLRLEDFAALKGQTLNVAMGDEVLTAEVLGARKIGGNTTRPDGGFAVDLRLMPHAPRQGIFPTTLPQGEVGLFMSPRRVVANGVEYEAIFN